MLYKKFILILLYTFLTINLKAQTGHQTISGKLVDIDSKEPLPFASIYLKGTTIGTTSNTEGYFVFHIPAKKTNHAIIISMMGYEKLEKIPALFLKEETIALSPISFELNEVFIPGKAIKPLTAREIVKKAHRSIPKNYPSEPYLLEGFIRDLQNEDGRYVEYLEYATKMYYQKNSIKSAPKVELLEVRRSYINDKHPWNDQWDRKNSIVDLIEDDFIRYDYGPIKGNKKWQYKIEGVLTFDDTKVYQISAINRPFQKATLYIDTKSFAFVRIELVISTLKNRNYSSRLTNGQQEVGYHLIFEYQKINDKMYLKYQKEEDIWRIYEGLETRNVLFTKYPKKELFINHVVIEKLEEYPFKQNLQKHKSIESQAKEFNPEFWKYYNAPRETQALSKIATELRKIN